MERDGGRVVEDEQNKSERAQPRLSSTQASESGGLRVLGARWSQLARGSPRPSWEVQSGQIWPTKLSLETHDPEWDQ